MEWWAYHSSSMKFAFPLYSSHVLIGLNETFEWRTIQKKSQFSLCHLVILMCNEPLLELTDADSYFIINSNSSTLKYHKIWLLLSNFFKEPPNAHIRAMRGQILFTLHPFHLLVWNQISSTMSPCMCPFHLQQTLLWGRKLKINGRKFVHPVYIL